MMPGPAIDFRIFMPNRNSYMSDWISFVSDSVSDSFDDIYADDIYSPGYILHVEISGLALLVCGILAKFAYSYLLKLSSDINYNLAPYIMIGCGVFVILVGFIGCWAAIKQHGWALKIYMGILMILVVVEIGGAIAGYVMKDKISGGLSDGLNHAVTNYYKDGEMKEAMDKIQGNIVKCCGVNSYKDYKLSGTSSTTTASPVTTPTANATTTVSTNATTTVATNATTTVALPSAPVGSGEEYRVPKSCCVKEQGCKFDKLITDDTKDTGFYEWGCYNKLVSETKDKFKIFGGVALGIAIFQILGIVCAYLLTKKFRDGNDSYTAM